MTSANLNRWQVLHFRFESADILRMVAAGYTSAEIGKRLEISGLTVNTHVKNIYRKLQVRSRAQAVNHASIFGML